MSGCDATGEAPGTRPREAGGVGGDGKGIGEAQEPALDPDRGGASVSESEAAARLSDHNGACHNDPGIRDHREAD